MSVLKVSALVAVMVPVAGLISCESKGPQPPKPGSPAFQWGVAQDAFKKGNFTGAIDQLARITSNENEYRTRARVQLMAVSAGLARGDMEFADAYDDGAKAARDRQLEFKRQASSARALANQHAMRYVELAHEWTDTVKDAEIPLGFAMPAVETTRPVELARAVKGITLQPAEIEKARNLMEQRGVALLLARLAGAGTDTKKAADMLASGDAKVTRAAYLLHTARELTDLTELYAPKKLDQSGRVATFCKEAKEALSQVPPSKEVSELQRRIDKIVAKLPKSAT
jgi:hypothetical protein